MSLSKEFAEMVQDQNSTIKFVHPLLCGREFQPIKTVKNRWMEEYEQLQNIAEQAEWKHNINLKAHLHNPKTAIIVTSPQEKIQWVNRGFSTMTGYEFLEVLGRNPNFLQGHDTEKEQRKEIKEHLNIRKPFSTTILNYRKNGEAYHCKIHIFPIFNNKKELVNFLAIEHEVCNKAA